MSAHQAMHATTQDTTQQQVHPLPFSRFPLLPPLVQARFSEGPVVGPAGDGTGGRTAVGALIDALASSGTLAKLPELLLALGGAEQSAASAIGPARKPAPGGR